MRDQHATRTFRSVLGFAPLLVAAVLFGGIALTGCANQAATPAPAPEKAAATELTVSAASSLKAAFTEIAPAFEKANNTKLAFNFGASGVLQKQIESGVPTDVFASASDRQVDALIVQNLVSAEATATFAGNDLVLIVPVANPAGIATLADLSKATMLVTGNPETAPLGTKTKEFLEAQGTWAALQSKFVFAENAAQTVDYVSRGEVDAGFVFASEAIGNEAVKVVYTVPKGAIKAVRYVATSIRASANSTLAKKFVDYLLTPEVQAVLVEGGFKPAPTTAR